MLYSSETEELKLDRSNNFNNINLDLQLAEGSTFGDLTIYLKETLA